MAARYCDQCGTRLPPTTAAANGAGANGAKGVTYDDKNGTQRAHQAPSTAAESENFARETRSSAAGDANEASGSTSTESAAAAHGAPPEIAADSARTVTALFADLADHNRMLADHDPPAVRQRVESALAVLDETVARFGGRRQPQTGDTVFALFDSDDASDATRAALCALEMRDAVAELAPDGDEPLAVRIALATNDVRANDVRASAVPDANGGSRLAPGDAIAIAAGLQVLAAPGEILADPATVEVANGRLVAQERGPAWMRGRPSPIRVHSVIGEAVRSATVGGRLVGRVAERRQLGEMIASTRRTRRGRVAVVVGDAGVGKTRLIADLAADARDGGVRWTWTENVSYAAGEPYRLVRGLIHAIAADEGTEPAPLARRLMFGGTLDPRTAGRVADTIAALGRNASANDWRSEGLLPPTNTAAAAMITEATVTFLGRLVELRGPRVIVVDDVQWADPSSQPLLERLIEVADTASLVIIAAARPGSLPAWTHGSDVERIDLSGLGPEETRELAGGIAGAEMGRPDAHAIYERTRGNPLFIDHTVRALLQDGSLAIKRGRAEFTADGAARMLPLTLRSLLAARIEALPEAAREVLGVAAVVGVFFDTEIVSALVGRPPRQMVLDALVDAGMIVPAAGHGTWRFAHPLIRETAHAGLATPRRRTLHARLADRIEASARPALARAARHRAAGGDVERAVPLLDRAAREALALGAAAEAAEFWRAATRLVGDFDPRAAEYRRLAVQAQHASSSPDDELARQQNTPSAERRPPAARPPILFDARDAN